MTPDDQRYGAFIFYIFQVVGIWANVVFTQQFPHYEYDHWTDPQTPYYAMIVFLVISWTWNVISIIRIAVLIMADSVISWESKQHLQTKASNILCVGLVILSGSSNRSLRLMSSNLFGLTILSAGLSALQLSRFMTHHFVATAIALNVPFVCFQGYFLFVEDLSSAVAIIAFACSLISVLVSTMEIAHYYLTPKLMERPFQITVSWTTKGTSRLDPMTRCGRRSALKRTLTESMNENEVLVRYEIMMTKKVEIGCVLIGSMVSSMSAAKGTITISQSDEQRIREAVIKAFGFQGSWDKEFDFEVAFGFVECR